MIQHIKVMVDGPYDFQKNAVLPVEIGEDWSQPEIDMACDDACNEWYWDVANSFATNYWSEHWGFPVGDFDDIECDRFVDNFLQDCFLEYRYCDEKGNEE